MKHGKKWRDAYEKLDRTKEHTLNEAITFLKDTSSTDFDQTLEIAIELGVDPRKSDQMVRGAIVLPHGLGKSVRVLAFAQGEKAQEAKDAGADYIGDEELAQKIQQGWMEFDAVIATPDMMKVVGKLGKVLGPQGLMPNPKVGTVTQDVSQTIKELKKGRVQYRVDKAGIVHAPLGKLSFDNGSLDENTRTLIDSIKRAKPSAAKGKYLNKVIMSSTMGQGLRVTLNEFN